MGDAIFVLNQQDQIVDVNRAGLRVAGTSATKPLGQPVERILPELALLGTRMNGSQKLVAELTIRAGRVVWDLNGLAADDWQTAPVRSGHD